MDDAWGTIEKIARWLDDSSTLAPETEKLLRIMKLTEETGEVTQAVIGTLGQNPRKGVTHTWDDVQAELCDVILTAMEPAPGGFVLRGVLPEWQRSLSRADIERLLATIRGGPDQPDRAQLET